MFWRKKKPQPQTPPQPSRSSKPASNDPNAAPPKLSLLSLESRLMFDAAAAATAAEVNQEQVAQEQADAAVVGDSAGGETQASTDSQDLLQAFTTYLPIESGQEVVFVDPTVPNYQDLLSGMDPNIEVIMLDGGQDGIEQMAGALSGRTDIDAIHIISHGTEGQLQLGTGTLTTESMTGQYADELATIQQALSEQADILVYGCDFAEGDVGQGAVALLSRLTGADVAASTDATGAATLGGDWTLETQTGVIETHIAVTDAQQMNWVGLLDISTGLIGNWTFDTNANDSSGNNYNGTLTNGAAIDTTVSTNIVGTGKLSLDGVNDYVDLTAHLTNFTALSQGTISAWIKTTGTSGVIFSSNDIADATSGTVLWVNSSGQLEFLVYENNTALVQVRSTIAVNDGTWHQVAVTNGASGNVLYIDGVQASVTYSTGNSTTDRFFDDVTGEDTLYIGRDQRSGGSIFFNGTIDDVRVYNRVLTGGDVAQLYATSNDAPLNAVPGAQSTSEDTSLVFSSGNGNQISITDPDSSGASFEVTVSVTNGSLTLAGTTGLTFTSGDGTTDTTMTFRGTVANINTALNGLTYAPTAEYNGGATLTVATRDSTLVSLDIDANLQARYTFEGTANDVALGTAQDGTLGGNATYVTDGTRGQVLSLDGVDDYVQIAGRFGDPANVTLAAWVNLTAADSLGSHVISLGDSVLLTVDEPSLGNGVSGVYYNGSTWVKLATGQFIAGTGWHHIAYIFDDTNNTNTLYIDGAAVATATASTSISYTQGANSFIGKHGNGQTAFDFNGKIDDARVYNRALTASEVASLAADGSLIDTDTVAITVTAVNDVPTISNLSGDSLSYSEGAGAVVIEQGANALVADIDSTNFDTGTLTISIPSGGDSAEDVLSILNQGTGAGQIGVSGSTVTYGGVTIGTFTGGSNGANLVITLNSSATPTAVTALIKNITYENTDAASPTTGARTVRYVLTDGAGGISANYDTTVTVNAVNDAPVLALGATNLLTNGSFESGATGWTGNTGVEVSNIPSNYGIPAASDGTYFVEVEGSNSPGVAASYVEQTFTTVVGQTYVVSLSAITRMDVSVQDRGAFSINGVEIGQFTTGTSWKDYAVSFTAISTSSTLQIISKGSLSGASPFANDGGGLIIDDVKVVAVQTAAAYTEGGTPVVLAGTARVFDAELSGLNTFSGATLTLARNGGANAEDVFSGSGTLSLSSGNVVVSGTTIGTYTNSGGTLQFTFNASATNTLVNSAMQQIAYNNSSDAPPSSVQVNWTFNDGNSGSQGSGGALSATGSTTITITAVNDAPTITNLGGDSLSYSEGVGAVVIEQGGNALVADVDSANLDTGTLTVSIPSGGDSAEDVLSIRNQGTGAGQIGVSGSTITYGGVTIGTFTGGSSGSNLVITLNSNATPTAVTALVKNITYQNTDTNAPTTGARTVRFVLTDGDGGTSADYDTTVTVSGVNDAPVLTDSGLTFTVLEDTGAPVNGTAVGVLLSTFTGNITDPDGAVAKGIAIVGSTETNGTWYYTTDAGATWLTVGVVSDSASLLLADTAGTRLYFSPNSNYNGNVFPGLIVRAWDQSSGAVGTKVDTSVQGGSTAFSVQGDTIDPTVTAVNDPPVFGHLDGTPTFTEGGAAVVLDANVTFTDPELSALNGGAGDYFGSSILLERNGGPDASDVFSATGNLSPLIEGTSLVLSGVTIGYVTTNSGGTLLITFDHNATSARVNEALQSVAYSNSSEAPSSSVLINWVSGDGNDGSQGTGGVLGASGSTTVTITTVNDAPVLADTALTLTVAETAGAPSGAVGSTISTFTGGITDVDSGATKGIAITGTNETNGTWYYTTNGGSTWAAVSAVSNTSALLLADNASTRLYFAPSADYNGTCTGALTLRAWDQTSGTAGTKVSTASNGGTTAFSSATDTIDVSVTAVNDAPTFGVGDGQATTSFGSGWEFGKETLLQPDGEILVAGYSDSGGSDDFSLTRYNADGTLDTSFGGGDGIALAGIVGRAETAVLQPDGKIVLSGYTTDGGYQVCLVRFNADGTLDTSFGGGDGIASSGAYGSAKDVALQTDGKFLVAADLGNQDFNLMRFNSDGSLDTGFGGGSGYVSTDLAGGNDRADSLTIQSDGKVILAGFGFNGTSFDFALVRYNTDGSLDTSFNGTGKVLTDFGGNSSDTGNEVRVQADGKIVVAGWSDTGGTNDFAIARYDANGTLDTGFGAGGQVTIDLGGSDLAEGLTIQADGKLLVTGTAGINGNDFGLVRLNTDGSLDTTFSGDGVATTDYTASSDDRAYSVAVQNDGQIVVSGTSKVGALGDYNYALTRYTSIGALDTTLDPVNTLDGAPTFTEGGSPVVLDGDVQIFDAELSALDNFNGATLTLARNGGANAEDQLVFDGVVVTVSGSAVSVNGVQVGTYTFTGGEMTITLNGNATQTRVNTLMQHILYSNVSDAPPASVQINWIFNDGNSGAQGTGGALQATGSTTVTITPVNDVPTITNLSGDSLAYSEGAGAVVIEQGGNALVADVDSSNLDTGALTVSISSGGDSAEDVLSIRNQGTGAGQIGVSGSNITYGGVTIGTFTGGSSGSNLLITFNSSATPTAVTALVKNITYENTDTNAPTTGVRTVRYVLTDGDGGTSADYDTTVTVSGVNDAPTDLSLSANTVAENAANGTVVGTATGTDPDTGDTKTYSFTDNAGGRFAINSATGQITVANGSLLNYEAATSHSVTVRVTDSGGLTYDETFTINVTNVNEAPTGADATVTINEDTSHILTTANFGFSDVDAGDSLSAVRIDTIPTAGSLTLSGMAVTVGQVVTVADITAGNLVFTPAADANGIGYASFTFSVRDSGSLYDSGPNTLIFDVTAVDDATVVTGGTSGSGNEDTTLTGTLTATDAEGLSDGTVFTVSTTATNGTASIDPATGLWSYTPTADWNGSDSFTVTLTDDAGNTATQVISVTVTAVNDAPVVAVNLGSTVAEGGTDTLDASELAVTDVDNGAAQLAYTIGSGPAYGRLELTTAPGVSATTFTQADIAANRLIYVHDGSETTSDNFTFTVNDGAGGSFGVTTMSLTITPVNDTPTMTSNGGGSTAAITVAENVSAVTIVTGADVDLPVQAITYSISGGVDQARFTINSATGALNFTVPPDFEAAMDANGDNVYVVQVRVTDGQGASTTQTIQVTVTDVLESAPPPSPPAPVVPPVLVSPLPLPGEETSGPGTSRPVAPVTSVNKELIPPPVLPGSMRPPLEGAPVNVGPLLIVPSTNRPLERVPEEPKRSTADERETPLFLVNDDRGRPLFSVLPVEPVPMLEPDPPERTHFVSDLLMAKLDEMTVSLEQAVDVAQEHHELVARVAAVTGTTLSVGFVAWALRSGAILASCLATMPAWRHFDPLPVVKLTRHERSRRQEELARASQEEAMEFSGLKRVLDDKPPLKRTA
ncbi:MAG: DUF4347 domain-containing protein [Nitrospira sp.]|nr:DUF4347 domain-containing protein [Nitrospira sp.]